MPELGRQIQYESMSNQEITTLETGTTKSDDYEVMTATIIRPPRSGSDFGIDYMSQIWIARSPLPPRLSRLSHPGDEPRSRHA